MPNDPGRPAEALRRVELPGAAARTARAGPSLSSGQTPDQWIRERRASTTGQPPRAPEPGQEEPPAFRVPVESLRLGALPAKGTRARDPNEWIRDMLGR